MASSSELCAAFRESCCCGAGTTLQRLEGCSYHPCGPAKFSLYGPRTWSWDLLLICTTTRRKWEWAWCCCYWLRGVCSGVVCSLQGQACLCVCRSLSGMLWCPTIVVLLSWVDSSGLTSYCVFFGSLVVLALYVAAWINIIIIFFQKKSIKSLNG